MNNFVSKISKDYIQDLLSNGFDVVKFKRSPDEIVIKVQRGMMLVRLEVKDVETFDDFVELQNKAVSRWLMEGVYDNGKVAGGV